MPPVTSKTGPIFSLTDVAVKAHTDPDWTDIPAVVSAAYKGSVTEIELTGDNRILGTLRHSQKGTITVKANYTAMAVLEKVSGNTGVVSGTTDVLPFGTGAELNPPSLAVRAKMPVTRFDGTTGEVTVYWYHTQVSTAFESLPGASYGAVTEVSLTFTSYRSNVDENGAALSTEAFGRIEFAG